MELSRELITFIDAARELAELRYSYDNPENEEPDFRYYHNRHGKLLTRLDVTFKDYVKSVVLVHPPEKEDEY